jgi:hypothetical protein
LPVGLLAVRKIKERMPEVPVIGVGGVRSAAMSGNTFAPARPWWPSGRAIWPTRICPRGSSATWRRQRG